MKNSVSFLAVVALVGTAYAAEEAKPKKAEPPTPATAGETKDGKAEPAKGPKIVVEPAIHDFGKAVQNKTLSKEFTLKNTGTEELVVGDVVTSCGCTVAQLATKTLKPGASTPLVVNLETRTSVGRLERTITVPSNDPTKKLLELKVTADVAAPEGAAAKK